MQSRIINKISNLTLEYIRKLRISLNLPLKHQYSKYFILLPPSHMLPAYQKHHLKYDRFLPYLAKHVNPSNTIIDVGANVGDSLAAMIETNPHSKYICIEPDELFFDYLQKNIARIKHAIGNLKIVSIQALVGKSILSASLEGHDGTKRAVVTSTGKYKSEPLDLLTSEFTNGAVGLIKSDVDGFDYDVLNSSIDVIKTYKPILFFECQFDFEYQKNGFNATLITLAMEGYMDWTVFDNYGAVILRTRELDIVTQLLSYLWDQNSGLTTRTIFYYDILVSHEKDLDTVNTALSEYSQ